MTVRRCTPVALALLALSAAAQTLSPTPAPGLWESRGRMTVNGQDLDALMKSSMAAALKDMPSEQRAMAEQMMKAQGMPRPGEAERECLTADQAARRSDARTVLADLQKDAPHCRFEPVKAAGATLAFKGRCNDPEGFSGDVGGEMTMDGPKAWSARWSGKGRMAGDIAAMPALKVGADGRVEFGWSGSGRWIGAACGGVKPQ